MFFEVQAKCGHVGRNHYIIKNFYVETTSAKRAAYLIRKAPRVKHHHKDAILSVREIDRDEYKQGVKKKSGRSLFLYPQFIGSKKAGNGSSYG